MGHRWPVLQLIDYYKILQVDPAAHADVIRAAYRVLARLYHPDMDGGSSEQMIALNNAWAVISDASMRAAYDKSRAALAPRATPAQPSYQTTPQRATAPAPSGPPTIRSTILDFGRYQGWSLEQIARRDPDFLEWLSRMPIGRPYRVEIATVLATVRATAKPVNGHK
jgi:curved DNA-binding protein CbpA